jgi:hypothetical protein
MDLTLLGSIVKKIISYGANLYHFTDAGVDVHRQSDGVRIAWAALADVTAGAVNDNGVYLGTSAAGVYLLPHAAVTTGGDQAGALVQTYTTGSSPSLQSNQVNGMAGRGTALLVGDAAGCSYLPTAGTAYQYAHADGVGVCAIGATEIAYAIVTGGGRTADLPAANWTDFDAGIIGQQFPGGLGRGLTFSGDGTYMGISGVPLAGSDVLTIEAWVCPITLTGTLTIFCDEPSSGGDIRNHLRLSNGVPVFDNYPPSGGALSGPSALPVNQWSHVAIIINAPNRWLVVNGAVVASDSAAEIYSGAAIGRATVGDRRGVGGEYFQGRISEMRVWDIARSTTDVATDYRVPLVGDEPGLQAYWRMTESGGTMSDSTGNGFTGAVTGATPGPANPYVVSDTISDIAYGADLFIATDSGVSTWAGETGTNITTPLGTVLDVKSIHPISTATKNSGLLAYGTSDGLGGGQFGVLDLAEA